MSQETSDHESDPQPIFQRLDRCKAYPYAVGEYAGRFAWEWVESLLFRPSPRRAYRWRRFWLRRFGARVNDHGSVRPHTKIIHPWMFSMGRHSLLADGVTVYSLGRVTIGDHTMVSQDVYICAGTHDHTREDLPLIKKPITIGSGVWVCAGAFIGPGVTIGDNAVIGARAVVMKDVPAGTVVAGNPSRVIKDRVMQPADTQPTRPPEPEMPRPVSPATDTTPPPPQPTATPQAPSARPRGVGQEAPVPVSIFIQTLDEEVNLPRCLESVSWCDDIVVLDSYSSDRTVEIAQGAGARVIQRRFDNWSAHQNWAMGNIDFKHPWVFYLDADELMTPEVKQEAGAIASDPSEARVAFYCGRRNYFMGKWLKHAMPPGMVMRFFKPSKIRFERLVNPTPVTDGPYGYLEHCFEHYSFGKGITPWLDKHNKYSQLEAIEGLKVLRGQNDQRRASLFDSDPAIRRKALKNLSFRMPFRPLLKFCYTYFLKLGFLDGRAGLTYCTLQAIYEYMITIKMKELQRREKGLQI